MNLLALNGHRDAAGLAIAGRHELILCVIGTGQNVQPRQHPIAQVELLVKTKSNGTYTVRYLNLMMLFTGPIVISAGTLHYPQSGLYASTPKSTLRPFGLLK